MDVSDGLVGDLDKMLRVSGVSGERRSRAPAAVGRGDGGDRSRSRLCSRLPRPAATTMKSSPPCRRKTRPPSRRRPPRPASASRLSAWLWKAPRRRAGSAATGGSCVSHAARSVIFERIDLLSSDARALETRFHAACAIAREAGEIAQAALPRSRLLHRRLQGAAGLPDRSRRRGRAADRDAAAPAVSRGRVHRRGGRGTQRRAEGAPIWVVDPIDGTANFARGAPHFCVSIAAVVGREIEIGVIYDPMMDELFAARRGAGATLNGGRNACFRRRRT